MDEEADKFTDTPRLNCSSRVQDALLLLEARPSVGATPLSTSAASTTTRTSTAARPQPGPKILSSSLHAHFHEEIKGHCLLNKSASCDGSGTFYSLQTRGAMAFVQSKCTAIGNALSKSNVIWLSLYRKKGCTEPCPTRGKSMLLAIVFS
jgi:hypothetical protein